MRLPYPAPGQVWVDGEVRRVVIEVLRDPHPVEFRAGGCSYVQQVGSVLMDVVLREGGAADGPHRYEALEWPPPGRLVEGPAAPWGPDPEAPRTLVHRLPEPDEESGSYVMGT